MSDRNCVVNGACKYMLTELAAETDSKDQLRQQFKESIPT